MRGQARHNESVGTSRRWSDRYVDAFCEQAEQLGLTAPRGPVATLIENHVRTVAERLGVTEKTARTNFTIPDAQALARRAAAPFDKEQPGHDLLDLPITHTVPLALAARTIAGLAITAELSASAAGADLDDVVAAVREPQALIASWGLLIERAALSGRTTHPDYPDIAVPEAAIHRAVRELDRGLHHLTDDITPLDGGDPTLLSDALTTNRTALQNELS